VKPIITILKKKENIPGEDYSMKKRNKYITLLGILFFSAFTLSAEITFSGYAGAKMDFYSVDTEKFDPGLKIQSFFSGQFVFSQNIILNTEFSLATDDIIDNSIFKEAPASFKVDEISLVIRKQFSTATNYLSAFMGTYEPIGSDIFLRRQFGIQPIASKITESWLGLSGSIIYPMFGAGGADVIHFNSVPLATGIYAYVNHELEDSYVFNGDLRFAGNFRYFTFDLAAGIGMPLNTDDSDNSFIVVNTLYWKTGANILIGNAKTSSIFIQAGFSEIKFKKKQNKWDFNEDSAYFLFEPRLKTKRFQAHLTAFSLPEDTVKNLIFIDDKCGANLNVFTDNLHLWNKVFTFGVNYVLSFKDKNIFDILDAPGDIMDDYTLNVAPYIMTNFYNGEIHFMAQVKIKEFIDDRPGTGVEFNLGYKTQF